MNTFTFVTGNTEKIRYLKLWLNIPFQVSSIDLPEIQSLALKTVTTCKVQEAYRQLHKPVLVEDVSLRFGAFGKLPGTFVKWFLQELGCAGMCELLNNYSDRSAQAEIVYALHDGQSVHYFTGSVHGCIADRPRGTYGFGWNSIFIPDGQSYTYAEMNDEQLKRYSHRAQAIQKLHMYMSP